MGQVGRADIRSRRRTVELRQAILGKNDRLAERNRGFFRARGLLTLNVLSSPGSGKTTFLEKTLTLLKPKYRVAALVGDLATENDAVRLARSSFRPPTTSLSPTEHPSPPLGIVLCPFDNNSLRPFGIFASKIFPKPA